MATNTAPPVRLTPARLAVLRAARDGTLISDDQGYRLRWLTDPPTLGNRHGTVSTTTCAPLYRGRYIEPTSRNGTVTRWGLTRRGREALDQEGGE